MAADAPKGSGARGAVLLAVLGIALVLRLEAMTSAYWFDEIWNTSYALAASGIAEIYARAHDNNHLLNTFAIHWIGPRDGWIAYRGIAFAAGIALLALAVFERGRTRSERVVRALLIGLSPVLVLLSTEARGYAPALAAAAAGFLALRRRLESGGFAVLLAFNLLLLLGLLSHLVFVNFYLASFAYSAAVLRSRRTAPAAAARELALLFGLPGTLAVLHGALFVAEMEIGGGSSFGALEFARRVVAFSYGVPEWSALCLGLAALGVSVFAVHLVSLRAAGDPRWVFDAVIVALSPLLLLSFSPGLIAVRYFALQIFFFLLVLADRIASWLDRAGPPRIAALVLLAVIVAGNTAYHVEFSRTGRGQYLEALRDMAAAQPGAVEIAIAGDHDSRVRLLVDFYGRFLDRPVRYVGRGDAQQLPPEWFVDHEVHSSGPPRERIGVYGNPYVLFGRYDFAWLSGFHWNVYRSDPSLR